MILTAIAIGTGLFACGLVCLVSRSHLIKMVMGLEFLGKGISVFFILGGYAAGNVAVSQAVVFTLIAIEAVVAGLALALVIVLRRTWKTFDSSALLRLDRGEP
ncbi:NADH-quinone oxidoreductase subunit K [Methanoregula formicica]|uniref:Multisubunit Na+/H+ antiporter, MnhC subunit n=1 Tax=Methanoregula formicica (strain DSM 22288 / NBRC 105244 / SMSP) TaxID=593750 RepID=L0HDS6_METFS|nr:NADH-quinone oxidoreductase subunit K [Methanoregula formicica]AGB01234.1 multisubunit Na+/H+ antiporter, MnhC subunit [Methanoregula formicica SMSP]